MSSEAVAAIMNAPDSGKILGRRNKAMLALLYDSAARVQELVDIEVGDLHLLDKADTVSNPFVTLRGKGNKVRNVNLSPKTAKLILSYMKEFHPFLCFCNMGNGQRCNEESERRSPGWRNAVEGS